MADPTDNVPNTPNIPNIPQDPSDTMYARSPLSGDQQPSQQVPSGAPPTPPGVNAGASDLNGNTANQATGQSPTQDPVQEAAFRPADASDSSPGEQGEQGEPAESTAPLPTPPTGARRSQYAHSGQYAQRTGSGWVALTLVAMLMLILGTALGVGLVKASPGSFRGLNFPAAQQTTTTPTTTATPQGLVGTPAPTVAVPPGASSLQQTIINVINTVQPSVVEVLAVGTPGSSTGSGEIVSGNGYIVTNDHVVAGYTTYSVTLSNGQTYPATLTG